MSKLRVHCFGVSLNGFGAGPNQDIDNPLGIGGVDLHQWFFPTRAFQKMHGDGDGTTGIDNNFAERGFDRIGAWILGRNMFAPSRGAWTDDQWKGWWATIRPITPRYSFSLTIHARRFKWMAARRLIRGFRFGESTSAEMDIEELGVG